MMNLKPTQHVSVFSPPGHKWIIDTGATDHITGRSELLQKKKKSQQSHVGLPNGHKALISCTDLARINAKTEVPDVLHVPSFHVNLLSVSKLTKSLNCSLTFYPDFCVLQDLETKKMIGLGKLAIFSIILPQKPVHLVKCYQA